MKNIYVNNDIIQDAENIIQGAYAPLIGFLRSKDLQTVLNEMRLADGQIWSIPVVLDIEEKDFINLKKEERVSLVDDKGVVRFILDNIEIYPYDKQEFARKVFGTENIKHPGVQEVMKMKKYLLGGDLHKSDNVQSVFNLINFDNLNIFTKYYYTPAQTKKKFQEKGWKKIVAFQTRNIPHYSHEFLQREALKKVDGLFVQPVIGKKKLGDFKNEVILNAYKILINKYYSPQKSLLGILPIKMRYAGPKEAVMHALIRRNYGCTHMIIGRDHAGVADFYNPYDAHDVFNQFNIQELGIEILKYENVSYCIHCKKLVFDTDCKHDKFNLSGTKIREIIKNKKELPPELIRPEISEFLINHSNPFVL